MDNLIDLGFLRTLDLLDTVPVNRTLATSTDGPHARRPRKEAKTSEFNHQFSKCVLRGVDNSLGKFYASL